MSIKEFIGYLVSNLAANLAIAIGIIFIVGGLMAFRILIKAIRFRPTSGNSDEEDLDEKTHQEHRASVEDKEKWPDEEGVMNFR